MDRWTDLRSNQHVRLSCGCEGFVKSIHLERDPLASGFVFLYTIKDCLKRTSCEDSYSRGEGPFLHFFSGALAEESMPAEESSEPHWWKMYKETKTNPEIKIT